MTLGLATQPAAAEAGLQPGSLGRHPLDGDRQDRRVAQDLGGDADRDRRDRAGRAVWLHRRERRADGHGEPDPQAGEGVGLAHRADDDQARVVGPEREEGRAGELGVGLVERDDRRDAAVALGIGEQALEELRDRALGLGEAGRVVRAAQPDEVGAAGDRAGEPEVDRISGRGAEPGNRSDAGPALLGQDPVHGVRRGGDDGGATGGQVGLRHDVEDLVGTGPDEDLVGRDAVARRRRLGQPSVVGGRVLGHPGLESTGGQDLAASSGGAGLVLRSNRATCSTGKP